MLNLHLTEEQQQQQQQKQEQHLNTSEENPIVKSKWSFS